MAHVYTKPVSGSERTPRPSLAKAGTGRENPFAAYLATASRDPRAAEGLAAAYAALSREARLQLIDTVQSDAATENLDAAPLLAILLGVERDVELAREIASAISATGGRGLKPTRHFRAFLAGDEYEGAAILARALHSGFVDLLLLSWTRDRGLTHISREEFARDDEDVMERAATLDTRVRLEQIPGAFAIDVVAPALWNHRRVHGELPAVLADFADLF